MGFLQYLLTVTLDCAVVYSNSPGCPKGISDYLHLNMMCTIDHTLKGHGWVNRNVSLLSKFPGTDLVAQEPQRLGIWPNEHDTEPLAEIRKPGFFGEAAPADPGSIGLSNNQRLFDTFRVQITAPTLSVSRVEKRWWTNAHRVVGLTHKHRLSVRLSEQCHR